MSLEQVVRLLGDCGPPVYLYFISLPSGGWDRAGVTRQTRNLNLAEVVISNHQDLLSHQPLHSPTQVRSLSLSRCLIIFVQARTPAIPARRQYRVKGSYKIVENISTQIIYI